MAAVQRADERLELPGVAACKPYDVVRGEAVDPKEDCILDCQPICFVWRQIPCP